MTPSRPLGRLLYVIASSFVLVAAGGAGCAASSGAKGRAAAPAPAAGAPAAAAATATPAAPGGAAPAPASGEGAAAPRGDGPLLGHLRVPLFDEAFGSTPAARVDGELITLQELVEALAESHEGAAGTAGPTKKMDVQVMLDRLVDLRLFVVEARDMKLDELPEVKKAIADFEKITAREMLKERAVAGVTPDAKEVESKVEEATREWKVKSVLFHFEVDAKDMRKLLDAGKSFDELAESARAQHQVKSISAGEFLPPEKMLPHVRAAIEKTKVGGVAGPIGVPGGFAMLAVEDMRHREDPAVTAAAETASRTNRSVATLREYYAALIKKFAKVDTKAIERLDLEAPKPGLAALAKSTRPLVTFKGEKPEKNLTVGELVREIQGGFFHGVESAVKEKRLNGEKWYTFDQMLFRRLLEKEAAAQKLAEDREYRRKVDDFTREQLFSTFMGRALLPEVKVSDAETRAYYDEHAAEYTYPRFFKVDSIAFASADRAQAALDTLRAGNDMKWVREHAEGRADESRAAYKFDKTLSSKAVPPGLASLLANARKGDHRLFAGDDGVYYVLQLVEDTPAEARPYEDAKADISKKLFAEKANAMLKEWAAKLRAGHDVEVFITRIGS